MEFLNRHLIRYTNFLTFVEKKTRHSINLLLRISVEHETEHYKKKST